MASRMGVMVGLGVVAAAVADTTNYIWNGRATDFNDPLNWEGGVYPSATSAAQQPGQVNVGRAGGANLNTAINPGTLWMGSTITFDGPATLVLGDGRGTTTLNFDPSNQNRAAVFQTDSDFTCPNNWIKAANAADDSCPIPAAGDTFSVQSAGDYVITVQSDQTWFPAATGITLRGADCVDGAVTATQGSSSVLIQFVRSNGSPDNPSCMRMVAGNGDGNGNGNGNNRCPKTECSQPDDIAAGTTTANPGGPNTSTGTDDGGGSSTIIIIVVVAAILIIGIVIAVVLVLKKKDTSSSNREVGQVSFENPMYDGAGPGDVEDDATYSEPISSSGYMDVPAGATGYMDVNPNAAGGSGYMDVAPEGESGGPGYMDVAPGFGEYDEQEDV